MSYDALFERRALGLRLELETIGAVFEALGRPCATRPTLHVVGTNGKGSIAAMAAHALTQRGLRVGRYTSPHLQRVTERVHLEGREVTDDMLQSAIARVLAHETPTLPRPLSFFEVLTLAALCLFEAAEVDAAVVEAGLGGRWDATRLVTPTATAIASIGLDHQAWLGSSLSEIAREKAAVMRPNTPAISGVQHADVHAVLEDQARAVGATLRIVNAWSEPPRGLAGEVQCSNAAVACAAAQILCPAVEPQDLDGVVWPGRLESCAVGRGRVIFDVAHNVPAVEALVAHLRTATSPMTTLFGCPSDKDAEGMIRSLTTLGPLWWVPLDAGQALPPGLEVDHTFSDMASILGPAEAKLAAGETLLVCGSHRLVGPLRGRWWAGSRRLDPGDPRR